MLVKGAIGVKYAARNTSRVNDRLPDVIIPEDIIAFTVFLNIPRENNIIRASRTVYYICPDT